MFFYVLCCVFSYGGATGDQKTLLELVLQEVLRCCVGARNETWVLCKSGMCS